MQPRRLFIVRGTPEQTSAAASELTAALRDVLTCSGSSAHVRRWLGRSVEAVVLDLHAGVSADVLGQVHGLIRAGGALILRMPPHDEAMPSPGLCIEPFGPEDVGARFWHRLTKQLPRIVSPTPNTPLEPLAWRPEGTDEQHLVVEQISVLLTSGAPHVVSLVADRGRGKSAALGLALKRAAERSRRPLRAIISAPSEHAAAEVLHFAAAHDSAGPQLEFVPPHELLSAPQRADVLVVDEAAQLPIRLLQEIVVRCPLTPLAFATTTPGYEGTGRGYVLRFSKWLAALARPTTSLSLSEPIRWAPADPLEGFISRLLCLDVEVPRIDGAPERTPGPSAQRNSPPRRSRPQLLTPDELAQDEKLLRSAFGLLVHAHYRTTPSDLQRLLDAPNLSVHAIADGGRIVAITLVAREGGLSEHQAVELATGRRRIRGHALADTLSTHAGHPEAAQLDLIRSVRIATHPDWRRLGLARRLVQAVEETYAADAYGTVFGATAELLQFRQRLGYRVVRLGGSRGPSTGQPAVVMLRAGTARGQALIDSLRDNLACNLPLQLRLLESDGGLPLDAALQRRLFYGLIPPRPRSTEAIVAAVRRYVDSPQPVEAAIFNLRHFLQTYPERLQRLLPAERALIVGRVQLLHGWRKVATNAGYPSVAAATRAIRGAIEALL